MIEPILIVHFHERASAMNPARPILVPWGHFLAFLQGLLVLMVVECIVPSQPLGAKAQPAWSKSIRYSPNDRKDRCPNPVRLSSLAPHEVQDATRSWFVRCCAGSGGVSRQRMLRLTTPPQPWAHHRVYFVCHTRAFREQQPNTAFLSWVVSRMGI